MTRSFKHWTIHYLFDRMVEKAYRSKNPDLPWLAPAANEFLSGYLKPSDTMLEFGSGRSTLWFCSKVAHITSVEHDPVWYEKISNLLKDRQIKNVTYLLHPKQEISIPAANTSYVNAARTIAPQSLDVVLVDGTYRAQCVLVSLPLLKPGSLLVIDNVNRYLPSTSHAPNSRTFNQGPIDEEWQQVAEKIGGWRFFWTSNGISDTAFYFKP